MRKVGSSYMTRALRASDRRYKVILGKLGYQGGAEAEIEPAEGPALVAARDEYREVVGRRPFNGWGLKVLRAKISEARAAVTG